MSDLAIRCEGVAKQYRIGERERYRALRDTLTEAVTAPFRRVRSAIQGGKGRPANGTPTIWALKDISFEVKAGEVVGIIGRNGAGKSTLLKILSRITWPTRGAADIYGRVGSLLEVGTGFHPELTGRENVYLNGAILGMTKAEVARKFDEIVAFAELEQFIDTPVKRYSSGMYMRLAFAVAAHLDPEIMLVDEVLAVGDTQFQSKCLGKMQDVSRSGRTVLFVSHSMPSIRRLCTRGLLLSNGEIEFDGPVEDAIERYLVHNLSSEFILHPDPQKPGIIRGSATWREESGIRLEVTFSSPTPLTPPVLGLVLEDAFGSPLFGTNGRFDPHAEMPESMESGTIVVHIATEGLRPATYYLSLWLGDHYEDHCRLERCLAVEVGTGAGDTWRPPQTSIGSFQLRTRWEYDDGGLCPAGGPAGSPDRVLLNGNGGD
jgi:lipopolysaccharide transport system ATP-binding protein